MKIRSNIFSFLITGIFIKNILFDPAFAFATQSHSDPEGLYVHQFSHLFFVFSMGILIFWLRLRNLIHEKGWRYIQYSAFLFIFWTIDAFTVHFLDEQYKWIQVTRLDLWNIKIDAQFSFISWLYYIVKLDHILCVPAMIFLYLGLKKLSENSDSYKFEFPGIKKT